MKKTTCMIFLSACLVCGGMAQEKIDRAVEDGVEVINNHLEPYKIKGEPTSLLLEKQFSIDTEQDEIARIGLVDIETFDVDSDGNIYAIIWRSDQNYIYKFDKAGRFLTTSSIPRACSSAGRVSGIITSEWFGNRIGNCPPFIVTSDGG